MLELVESDNGVGLPEKRRDGSLGLKLIRRFAEQLGGELSVTGTESTGTCIALRMPHSNWVGKPRIRLH